MVPRIVVTARLLGGLAVRALTAPLDAGSRRNAQREVDACRRRAARRSEPLPPGLSR